MTARLDKLEALESHILKHQVVGRRARRLLLMVGLPILGIVVLAPITPFLRTIVPMVGLLGIVLVSRSVVNVWLLKRARDSVARGAEDIPAPGEP